MKKRARKILRDSTDIAKSSLFLGLNSTIVTSAGGSAAGLASFSRYMSPIGSIVGAGHTLDLMQGLSKGYRRKKK